MTDEFVRWKVGRGGSLKRVKIIYEVADIARGTKAYRFWPESGTCLEDSTRAGWLGYRESRDARRYRSPAAYPARVCERNRVHAD